jgi:putative aldouronate transport system substrate-binding protein
MRKEQGLSFILAMLLIVGMLGACAAPAATTEPAAQTDAAATDAAATDGTLPVIRVAYTRIFATDSEQKIEDALNVIMRKEAQAEIDLVPVDFSSMNTQFNLMLTGGEDSIDIFSSFWYMPMSTLYANGQLAPLNDLLASDGQGILDLFADVPGVLECSQIDGQYYGLPSYGPYSTSMIYIVKEGASTAREHRLVKRQDAGRRHHRACRDEGSKPG